MKLLPALLLTLTLLPLGGCVVAINTGEWESDEGDWKERQADNVRKIAGLELNRSRSDVEAEFGEPDLVDVFQRQGDEYQVLFYRTQRVKSDGVTTRDETTPLVFVDGKLVGWGSSAIDKAAR